MQPRPSPTRSAPRRPSCGRRRVVVALVGRRGGPSLPRSGCGRAPRARAPVPALHRLCGVAAPGAHRRGPRASGRVLDPRAELVLRGPEAALRSSADRRGDRRRWRRLRALGRARSEVARARLPRSCDALRDPAGRLRAAARAPHGGRRSAHRHADDRATLRATRARRLPRQHRSRAHIDRRGHHGHGAPRADPSTQPPGIRPRCAALRDPARGPRRRARSGHPAPRPGDVRARCAARRRPPDARTHPGAGALGQPLRSPVAVARHGRGPKDGCTDASPTAVRSSNRPRSSR